MHVCYAHRLRISSLTVKDSGVYTCEAFNKYGARSTQGYLNVVAGQFTHITLNLTPNQP